VEASDLDSDPLRQVAAWLDAARQAGEAMPQAMSLATATSDGRPAVRVVVLRQLDSGLVFFTDDESEKAADLKSNPRAAVVLHWLKPAHRQVRAFGPVAPVDPFEADRYWAHRPPGARWTDLASHQSRVVPSREALERRVAAWARHVPDETRLGRPRRWVGFRITPDSIEFWEEAADRVHDRLRFQRPPGGEQQPSPWRVDRLSP
jgi:pyridoxamine 5'-phosphate oxidase